MAPKFPRGTYVHGKEPGAATTAAGNADGSTTTIQDPTESRKRPSLDLIGARGIAIIYCSQLLEKPHLILVCSLFYTCIICN